MTMDSVARLTEWVHSVSMSNKGKGLGFDELVRTLDEFAGGPADPDDPKARTRARILKAAKPLFEKLGYRRTSIDDVARDAGIAKGTVYVHFKSKAELLFHVLIEEKRRLVHQFRPVFDPTLSPLQRVRLFVELLVTSFAGSPLSVKLMTGDPELLLFLDELPNDLRQAVLTRQAEVIEGLLGGLEISDEERPVRVRAFQGLVYALGSIIEARGHTGLSLQQYATQLAKILVDGLRSK